jgi:hypothetical protein
MAERWSPSPDQQRRRCSSRRLPHPRRAMLTSSCRAERVQRASERWSRSPDQRQHRCSSRRSSRFRRAAPTSSARAQHARPWERASTSLEEVGRSRPRAATERVEAGPTRTGTLWSWPGQNPMRWRDPYGQGAREEMIAFGAVLGADVGMVLGGGTGIAAGLASGGIGFGATPWLAAGGAGLGAVAGGIVGGAIYDTTQLLQGLLDGVWMANRTGAGRNEPHGDAGRALDKAEERIRELEAELAELKRTQGSRKEKLDIQNLIERLRKDAERKRKGETHGRRGKGCR